MPEVEGGKVLQRQWNDFYNDIRLHDCYSYNRLVVIAAVDLLLQLQ